MWTSLFSRCLSVAFLGLLLASSCTKVNAQLPLLNDHFRGGVVVGNFSVGTSTFGGGAFDMPIPPGATVRSATLYAIQVSTLMGPVIVKLDGVEHLFGSATATAFTYVAPPYGVVTLHAMDMISQFDPTVLSHTIVVPPSESQHNRFVDFTLLVTYNDPTEDEVWVDLFWCDLDSQPTETYTITTSSPIDISSGVAFGTMASYCALGWQDCEFLSVNGTTLGSFSGQDHNAASIFGASASFKYSGSEFIGLHDDDENLSVSGPDALSNIASLLADQATSFEVSYTHCPSASPDDNLMNLMMVVYANDICALNVDLGPDTMLCAGETLLVDASRGDATYTWQDGSTQPTYNVTGPGTYIVRYTHPICDWAADSIEVSYAPELFADLGPDQVLCIGDETTLHVHPVDRANYVWNDGAIGPVRVVDHEGTYGITVSYHHCLVTDEITVVLDSCQFELTLPNIFTPNGDGLNDEFAAIALRGVRDLEISIFNRWGQLMFRSTAPAFRWNGRTMAGGEVPDGTYFWELRYSRERDTTAPERSVGTVTLTR